MFALMALIAFGWQARKEAHGDGPETRPTPRDDHRDRAARSTDRVAEFDRVAEADRRAAEARASGAAGGADDRGDGGADAGQAQEPHSTEASPKSGPSPAMPAARHPK